MQNFTKHLSQSTQPTIGGTTYWSMECVPAFNLNSLDRSAEISLGFLEKDGYA